MLQSRCHRRRLEAEQGDAVLFHVPFIQASNVFYYGHGDKNCVRLTNCNEFLNHFNNRQKI